ncbi:MAG TPA: galactokinase family protein [Thermoleophilaceae bacterium]
MRARSPGRVNLIGEHTDYNGGLSLPFAIERGVTATVEHARGGLIEVEAEDLGERDEFAASGVPERVVGWRAFARGVVAELAAAGFDAGASRITIAGDLPRGSGLSSSAALSTALCLALLGGDERFDRVALARLCSRVENEWVGARGGLLDQLAVLSSREGHALRIDFESLALEHVPLELGDWTLAVLDSGQTHDNAASGYNERRAECERASELLGVATLRHASAAEAERLPPPLDRRVRHVLEEDARVDATVAALAHADMEEVGHLLDASHRSLRDLYEVSTPELERAVGEMKATGAAGARLVGGGFGGSVLGLFPPGATPPEGAEVVRPGPPARLI